MSLIFPLIYTGYWAYRINKEIAEHDSSIDVDPVMSGLAFSLGALLVIPSIISAFATLKRMRKMEEHCEGYREYNLEEASALLFTLFITGFLFGFGLTFFVYYVQDKMNSHWEIHAPAEFEETAAD